MGLVYADIRLENLLRPDLAPVEVRALVDTGAINLCLPAEIASQLDFRKRSTRIAGMADGSTVEVDMVAPVTLSFMNRETTTTAMVLGDEVLLGAIPMQDLDVVVDSRNERLMLPPERPNFALSKVK